jgi:hypothetical protein
MFSGSLMFFMFSWILPSLRGLQAVSAAVCHDFSSGEASRAPGQAFFGVKGRHGAPFGRADGR